MKEKEETEREDIKIITAPKARDMSNKTEAIARIVSELFKKDNLNRITEVDNKEIELIAIVSAIDGVIDSPIRKSILTEVKELRISRERSGRLEVLQLAREEEAPKKEEGILDKILGRAAGE